MRISLSKLADGVLKGDRFSVARALTLVEAGQNEIVQMLYSSVRNSLRLGFTGPPGVGKSTLVTSFGLAMEKKGMNPAVLAIDPTSEITGGALLGDRIRMLGANFFVRSMATRMRQDGLAPRVYDAVHILDAAGFNPIIVETVGVGQAAVGVRKLVDIVVLALMPNSGDSVQTEKAGIFEIGDIFALNKSDLSGGDLLFKELRAAGVSEIVKTVATTGQGMTELLEVVERLNKDIDISANRLSQKRQEVRSAVLELAVTKADSGLESHLKDLSPSEYAGSIATDILKKLSP